jgi:hypothetical protein
MSTYVILTDIANALGMDKSAARRFALRNGVEGVRTPLPSARGAWTLVFPPEDLEKLKELKELRDCPVMGTSDSIEERGVFYMIQLIPEHVPTRVKFGYASSFSARLDSHRTAAPTAIVFKSWPAKRSWESALIDVATAEDCTRLSSEVFDCPDLKAVVSRLDKVVKLLPVL